jgi:hypothetical protein
MRQATQQKAERRAGAIALQQALLSNTPVPCRMGAGSTLRSQLTTPCVWRRKVCVRALDPAASAHGTSAQCVLQGHGEQAARAPAVQTTGSLPLPAATAARGHPLHRACIWVQAQRTCCQLQEVKKTSRGPKSLPSHSWQLSPPRPGQKMRMHGVAFSPQHPSGITGSRDQALHGR